MISVIICTYNRDKYIYGVLESIAKGDYPKDRYEIVLVDNNCTDSTALEVERFRSNWPDVNIRCFVEKNQGLSFARNRGIAEAEGELLVFLDDDAFVGPDYLNVVDRNMSGHPETDCFGGNIKPEFEDGTAPAWICKWSLSWVSGLDMGNKFRPFTKGYPIGANMGLRRQVFKDCGVYNTELGRCEGNLMGGEEKDMFNRVRAAGKEICFIPGIEVRHMIPQSRTTRDYVVRLGQGIGKSEKIRCKSEGCYSYAKRLAEEAFKWCATIVLWAGYLLRQKPVCGNMLIVFRWNVSKGLLGF